jgi:YD repeat-containing protein
MAGSGGVTSTAYDAYHLYATTTTNALGHMTTTETDYRFGKPTKIIGPNGSATDTAQQTRYDYDEAGRL